MNIQGFQQSPFGMPGGLGQMGSNPMAQVMQAMMQIMQMMQMMSGGQMGQMGNPMGGGPMGGGPMGGGPMGGGPMGGMSSGANPGFGGGGGGCGCGGGGGGIPGLGNFGGNGSVFCGPSGSNGGNSGGNGLNAGGFNGRDSYVPSGTGQSGNVGNLGSGQGADAARWALGKEGISESNNPGAVRQISNGKWQPWCADFVSQAYKNSPGGSPFGHQSSVAGILGWGRQNGRFFDAGAASQNPGMLKPGDIATWKSNGKSHVGLVTGINENGTFNTIEGNSGDAVRKRTHSFGKGLTGFVRPRGQMPGR